jgi:hypothetical protein
MTRNNDLKISTQYEEKTISPQYNRESGEICTMNTLILKTSTIELLESIVWKLKECSHRMWNYKIYTYFVKFFVITSIK